MAIFNAIHDDTTMGQTYELAGYVYHSFNTHHLHSEYVYLLLAARPKEYILFDLVEYIYQVLRRPYKPYSLPKALYKYVYTVLFTAQ